MPEIFRISDRYTVFRNGEYIASGTIDSVTPEEVTRLLVGNTDSFKDIYETREDGEVILRLSDYSGPGFEHINLDIRKGQIVGLTGLQGAGSSELMQCMFGITRSTGGELWMEGKRIPPASTHKTMKAGIAMLASNRKENSVIPDMSLLENMYLAEHTLSAKNFAIHKKEEQGRYEKYREMLNIKAQDSSDSILSLSGGNQQKVFLARWLNTNADVLLLDNPTQGIDVGAKAEIYKLILELAKEGKTILINTLEIPEIQKIADYCAVFYEGRIAKILPHSEIDEQTVMMYSTNAAGA
jgi:ribose transport system ATP-binding protein